MATTELIELAIETSKHAYVPYSHFPYRSSFSGKRWKCLHGSEYRKC